MILSSEVQRVAIPVMTSRLSLHQDVHEGLLHTSLDAVGDMTDEHRLGSEEDVLIVKEFELWAGITPI